ncbi:Heat shock protein, Hsp20 family [Labilithrix luteola]|uniref:Heat shock protein, Hsp20 family n=1 Tax=Labilithrix luteola TaxID=1391654 RepID=A0A0K1PZ73_9BACT|nr:Heat shock protein, Hsp20 family [Labilithrix luteola]
MFDRLFDDAMTDVMGGTLGTAHASKTFTPAIDVHVTEDEIVFACDVPGVKASDLEVTIDKGVLTIKGQRKFESPQQSAASSANAASTEVAAQDPTAKAQAASRTANGKVWLGRSYGSFARSYTLPEGIDAEKMVADLSDGVLSVRIPKVAKPKPRRIEVKIGTSSNG